MEISDLNDPPVIEGTDLTQITLNENSDFVRLLVATDQDEQASFEEVGEIWIRGTTVTPGYWNRPNDTNEAYLDGWLKSGDICRIDSEGKLTVEGRKKDIYISGGENV